MRVGRFLSVVLITGVLVLVLCAGGVVGAENGILKVRMAADFVNLDPAYVHTAADHFIAGQVMECLVQFDWSAEPPYPVKPRIAKSYEVSEDGREIVFKLNTGIQFHGGYGELTSEDVAYTMRRNMDPEVASMAGPQFSEVEDVTVLDRYTLKVTFKSPTAVVFLQDIGWQGAGLITSKKAVEELGEDLARSPIGTGPYYFDSWEPGLKVVLKRFPDYWGAPKWGFDVDGVAEVQCLIIPEDMLALDALEAGEVDIVGFSQKGALERAQQIDGAVLQSASGGTWQHQVYFNNSKPPLDDRRVRQALCYALDLPTIADRLGDTQKCYSSPFNAVVVGSTDEFWCYDYDPAEAKRLLAEAGYADGLTLDFIYSKVYMYEDVVLEVVRYWEDIGIDVQLRVIEYGVYYNTMREFEHDVCFWSMTRFSPATYANFYVTGAPRNLFAYSNPALEELIMVAKEAPNQEFAAEMWGRVQRAIINDAVGVWPALQVAWVAVSEDVQGVIVIPFTLLADLAGVQLK